MSSAYLNASYANLDELSPSDNSGENSFDVNYVPPSYGGPVESGYYADSEFVSASSEQYPELGPDAYSDSYLDYDGSQVYPIYYPIPTYYQVYYGVSSVENNGTTFYHYYPFAVPIYCLSSEVTTESITSSDVSSMSDPVDFTNETFENVNEVSYSDQFTPSSNNGNDIACNDPPEELIDEFTEYYDEASYSDLFTPSSNDDNDVGGNSPPEELNDEFAEYYDEARDSSIIIPESDFMAEESKNDIKRKKDWLYLLSLSGKLKLKDHIPTVDVMPVLFENDKTTEISENNIESDESLHTVSCTDISPQIDKDHGDPKKKCPDNVVLETSHALSTNKEPPEKIFLDREEEKDAWEDSFFRSIDDEEFGIESCFNNTFENQFVEKSSNSNEYRNKSNSSSRSGRTFMILRHLNKQVEILPTIYEEEEDTKIDDILNELTGSIPLNSKDENLINLKGESVESKQQTPVENQKDFGLPEATNEASPLQKPKKKRLERFRRFFSRMTNCFRITKESPG